MRSCSFAGRFCGSLERVDDHRQAGVVSTIEAAARAASVALETAIPQSGFFERGRR